MVTEEAAPRDWPAFLSAAGYVLADPLFVTEERDRKLTLAADLRAVMELGADEGLAPALDASLSSLSQRPHPYRLLWPQAVEWLMGWARSDGSSLRQALASFLDSSHDAEERFNRFAEAARARTAEGVEWRPSMALTFGSIFNFAVDPHALPIVRRPPFQSLSRTLGYEAELGEGGVVARYERCLAFARWLKEEMVDVGVRDMLDVQAIIMLSETEAFWRLEQLRKQVVPAPDPDPLAKRPVAPEQAYLAICSCLGYDAPYLHEWIEFHRLMGVTRFFLYNNGDREAQRQLLAPYVEEGLVVLHDWPQFPPQVAAYVDCIERHREDARWIAFIDTDEFLFSPNGHPLPGVVSDYEDWPAVTVNMVGFFASGHRTKPPGLVIESYTTAQPLTQKIKSIVDPMRVEGYAGPHRFIYRGTAVSENKHPVYDDVTIYSSVQRLQLNHYRTRSEAEFLKKGERRRPDTGEPYLPPDLEEMRRLADAFGRPDDAILQYVPPLKERLREIGA
jgi:hypothetical protein